MISNRIRLLAILTVSWFFTMCDRYVTQMLFPVFETLFMIPNELILIVSTEAVWWAAYSTSAIIGGKLSDRFLRQYLISITLSIYFLNTFLISFVGSNFTLFIFFRIMSGLFAGTFFPLAISIVSDAFPEKNLKSRANGIYVSGAVFANAMAPVLIGYLIENTGHYLFAHELFPFYFTIVGSWGLIYQIFSIPLLIMAIVVYFGFDEREVIKDIDSSIKPSIRSLFNKNLVILITFITLDLFELWTLQQWLPYIFQVFFLGGFGTAGLSTTLGGLIGAFGAIIFGIIGGKQSEKTDKKKGNKLTLMIAVCGDIGGLLFFISLPRGQGSIPFALIAIMIIIFAGTGEYAAIYTLISESVPPSVSGKTMGLCIGIANFSTVGGLIIQGIVGSNSPTILTIMWIPIIAAIIQLPISYLYDPTR